MTTAIFSVIEGALLRSLPYPAVDRLVVPQTQNREEPADRWTITYADYEDWRRAGVFAHVAAYRLLEPDMSSEGVEPHRVRLADVSEDFFATLGLAPMLGRYPTPGEFTPGQPAVIVISHGLWQRVFGGEAGVLGRTVRLRDEPVSIVGVAPPDLDWPRGADAWSTQQYGSDALAGSRDRDNYVFQGIARLAPGRSLEETRVTLDGLARRVERDHPTIREHVTVTAMPIGDFVGSTS